MADKVKDLKTNSQFEELELEVTSKGEIRSFANQRGSGKVCSVAAKDETGEIRVTLWNEQCEQVNEGDTISITSGWCSEYNGEKQVSTGRQGELQVK